MKLSIIVAMNKDRIIGKNGKLPWYYPEDLAWFKEKTSGSTVIMGRKTWESIGENPLPNRNNLIVSSTLYEDGDYEILDSGKLLGFCRDIPDALDFLKFFDLRRAWFIGGARIYIEALECAEEMWITQIPDIVEQDDGCTYFPEFKQENWCLEEKSRLSGKLEVFYYERKA